MSSIEESSRKIVSPLVRVVHGHPTAEELVALVTGLLMIGDMAGTTASPAAPQPAASAWSDPARLLRARPYGLTPGAWVRSSPM